MNDNRPLTYLRRLIEKVDSIKNDIGGINIDLSPVTNKIDSFSRTFDAWKADWTSGRAAKIDNLDVASSTLAKQSTLDSVNSSMAKDATVAKQTTLNTVNSTLNSVNTNMAKQSTLNIVNSTLNTMKMPDSRNYGIKSFTGCESSRGGSFKVNGKGLLISAFIRSNAYDSQTDFKIVADGVTICDMHAASAQNYGNISGIAVSSYILEMSRYSDSASVYLPVYSDSYKNTMRAIADIVTLKLPLINNKLNTQNGGLFVINDPIKFERNLTISFSSSDSRTATGLNSFVGLL